MDSIFGRENFRSEIIWQRYSGRAKGSQHVSQSFGVDDDRLLFYTRTAKAKLIHPYVKLSQDEIEQRYPKMDAKGRRYTGIAHFRGINMGTRPNLCYEWRGFKNPNPSGWRVSKERLEAEYQDGKVVVHSNGRLERRRFFDPEKGKKIGSIWTDIQPPAGEESTGYPTQKPLALYERIIKASSNPGDIVLDAFCGCATTCVAAEKLARQWIGIDIWDGAHDVTIDRLKKEGFLSTSDDARQDLIVTEGKIDYVKTPFIRTDGGSEAVPFLETLMKEYDDREHDPYTNTEKKEKLLEQYGPYCQGCGINLPGRYFELDHIRPRSDGGSNLLRNRTLLCGPCNKLKRNMYTMSWLRKENKKQGLMQNERALAPLK